MLTGVVGPAKRSSAVRAKVSSSGRLRIPAGLRRALGLERGGDVVVELDGRDIRIRTIDEVVRRAQALTRQLLGGRQETSVEAFLLERRRHAIEVRVER
jgi:AbrB family looped-hinge helix DNA binding protein